MQKLEIGRLGRIVQGPKQDWYVKVDDDSVNTGGYLVLLSRSLDPSDDVGFDDWVETEPELQAYFERSGWTIEWIDDKQS